MRGMDAAILANVAKKETVAFLPKLVAALEAAGFSWFLPETDKKSIEAAGISFSDSHYQTAEWIGAHVSLIFSVGGDGSYLQAARVMADHPVSLVGIHLGNLGFLNLITPETLESRLADISDGAYDTEKRIFLSAKIRRADGTTEILPDVLNDIVIGRSGIGKMARIRLDINGRFLEEYPADGLVVATPTGSTSYAMSCGGPILDSRAESMVVVPICPHIVPATPLVLENDTEISIRPGLRETELSVSLDGNGDVRLLPKEEIVIATTEKPIRFIRFRDTDFYEIVSQKLLRR